jgi:Asp-tRNA(Asn)/Glu-tRNA(Gln) amidotransferase A subunit family amidase
VSFNLTVETAVDRIRERGTDLRAYVSTRLYDALDEARALAEQTPRSPLHGVPFGLKDEWETTALPTTGGSYRHRNRRPLRNSDVARVFTEAGAVLVGKTNLSDMGLAPEASSYVGGTCRNPHDGAHTAGGSSGGAAAAVAAGMQAFDWGTDIGGSIRLPAAFCGVLGMRLSSATWPMQGSFPVIPSVLEWMCGQGPFTHTIEQMELVLDVAAPRMRTGEARPFNCRGVAIHVPDKLGQWPTFASDVQPHLSAAVDGELITQPDLPGSEHALEVNAGMWASHLEELLEADSGLTLGEGLRAAAAGAFFRGRFGDRRFHPATAELLLLIALGRVTLFRDKRRALERAHAIRRAYERIWDDGYLVVAPVCCYPAPRIGRSNYNQQLLACTVAGNLADATSLAIPFGSFGGLPRALQIMGPPGSERVLLHVGEWLIASRDCAHTP